MRDDVKKLFDDLLTHLDEKTQYLNKLLENGKHISRLIKLRSDNENDILKIFHQNNELIDRIDIEDYHISAVRDEITCRYSFDFEKIFRDNYMNIEAEIIGYRKKITEHKNLTLEIQKLNDQNYNNMNSAGRDLKQQISEIQRMSRIQIIYPGNNKL